MVHRDPMPAPDSIMRIRASSFGGLFGCAYRWEGIHLLGMENPGSPRALIGTGVHAGTAAFDQARLDNRPISLDFAAGVAADAMTARIAAGEVRWMKDEPDRRQAEAIATRLTRRYCAEVSPRYEFLAVEQTVKPLDIACGGGVTIRLTGTMDRSRTVAIPVGGGRLRRVVDVKSGRAAVNRAGVAATKKHKPQLGTYQLLDEHTSGETVDDTAEVIGLNTMGRGRIGFGETTDAKQLLRGTPEQPGLLELAAQMFRTGFFPPNPQSSLCDAKFCPRFHRCPYGRR